MNTDRELLEKAAKAAGYEFGYVNDKLVAMIPGSCGTYGCTRPHSTSWDPINDDGDALRLAVKLGLEMDLLTGEKAATTVWYDGEESGAWKLHEPHGGDPCVATRRAIVRAAAAIGEQMP